jgi:hypothetical protein
LSGFPLETAEKDHLLGLINRLSRFYFVDVLGFCVMPNHFRLVTRMYPAEHFSTIRYVSGWLNDFLSDERFSSRPLRDSGINGPGKIVRQFWDNPRNP